MVPTQPHQHQPPTQHPTVVNNQRDPWKESTLLLIELPVQCTLSVDDSFSRNCTAHVFTPCLLRSLDRTINPSPNNNPSSNQINCISLLSWNSYNLHELSLGSNYTSHHIDSCNVPGPWDIPTAISHLIITPHERSSANGCHKRTLQPAQTPQNSRGRTPQPGHFSPSSGEPLCRYTTRSFSTTRSVSPLTQTIHPTRWLNALAASRLFKEDSELSTPLDCVDNPAIVMISDALPRIKVRFRLPVYPATFDYSSWPRLPTGSGTTGCPTSFAAG